jgi:molybdenum cofactor cytidylyltransferase
MQGSNSVNSKPLFAIVLAAGTASRFGAIKQLADYQGLPLVCHASRLAEHVCPERSVLVTGSHWREVHAACAPLQGFWVNNDGFENGIGSSIASGVRAVAGSAGAVLLMLADQPLIDAQYLRQMIETWNGSEITIVCSEFSATVGPPVIFPARYYVELLLLQGDNGARALLADHAEHVIGLPCEAAARDIDVPADLVDLQS